MIQNDKNGHEEKNKWFAIVPTFKKFDGTITIKVDAPPGVDSAYVTKVVNDMVRSPSFTEEMMKNEDTSKFPSMVPSALLLRYKFSYAISAKSLLNKSQDARRYTKLNILAPVYTSTLYPRLIFSEKLVDQLNELYCTKNLNNIVHVVRLIQDTRNLSIQPIMKHKPCMQQKMKTRELSRVRNQRWQVSFILHIHHS